MKKSNKLLLTMFAATASMVATSFAALATPAQSNVALNVRSGPGTSYGVVDTLLPGEDVDVTECVQNGWCHIQRPGPDGWVSAKYLVPVTDDVVVPEPEEPADSPDCGFGFTIGPNGPTFSINCGDATPPPPAPPAPPAPTPTPTPTGNVACLYTGANFTGSEFCHGPATLNTLDGVFNDKITSFKLYGNAKVKLCRNANLAGTCRKYSNDRAKLPPVINNKASSLAVYTGAAPGGGGGGGIVLPTPLPLPLPLPLPTIVQIHSSGSILLKQTFSANLDNGAVSQQGADVWYRAKTALDKMLTPRNGAKLALGNGSKRSYNGCKNASYSSNPVSIWVMPVGTHICVKTNKGRYGRIKLTGYQGTTMKLNYVTWK